MTSRRGRLQDVALGFRLAAAAGREGWLRNALTAFGIGIGVALMLVCASIPHMAGDREHRSNARVASELSLSGAYHGVRKGKDSLLVYAVNTVYGDADITGRLVQPDDPKGHPPVPPGLTTLPGPGEMAVSPALKALLDSPSAKTLRQRLPYRDTATIGKSGLLGPGELFYYAGRTDLASRPGLREVNSTLYKRTDHFGVTPSLDGYGALLQLLILFALVALLLPVGIFVANAVRIGGERRDRRLAALRLVGADSMMTRRIAGGETMFGATLGLAVGVLLFLVARAEAASVSLFGLSVFPSDINPGVAFPVLIVAAVLVGSVLVTLSAMRGVAVEPMGVVREAGAVKLRLWWRLLLPVVGLGLLIRSFHKLSSASDGEGQAKIVAGAVLLLVGLTFLVPWLVEVVAGRFRSGPISWELAVRRIGMGGSAAARMVGGVTVAVAGAIALQMLFTAVQVEETQPTQQDTNRAQISATVFLRDNSQVTSALRTFRHAGGVTSVFGFTDGEAGRFGAGSDAPTTDVTVGDCAALREVIAIKDCSDGDVFLVPYAKDSGSLNARPGMKLDLGGRGARPGGYQVPRNARSAGPRKDPIGKKQDGVFFTPSALDVSAIRTSSTSTFYLRLDPANARAADNVRTAQALMSPFGQSELLHASKVSHKFSAIVRAIMIGVLATVALVGISLLISTQEQLRERKRLLAALVALGTRRGTLSASVILQTAIPLAVGLAVAAVGGLVLGAALQTIAGLGVRVEWSIVVTAVASGGAVALGMTLLSLPLLWKLTRPNGLRTE